MKLERDMNIDVKHDFPFLKMHFEMEGYSTYTPHDTNSLEVNIPGGHHQLFFFPQVDGQLQYKAHQHRNTLEITLSLDVIKRVFHQQWELLFLLGHAIQQNKPIVVGQQSAKITSSIYRIIEDILQCPIKGPLKQNYLEAKVVELFIMQIQSLTTVEDYSPIKVRLNHHKNELEQLAIYLQANISEFKTIEELAKMVGMNTSKLKSEFKITFGETIFAYQVRLRMEYAKNELKLTQKSITTIANETGYNYVQHFSKAFKKFHGSLPSEVRADQ